MPVSKETLWQGSCSSQFTGKVGHTVPVVNVSELQHGLDSSTGRHLDRMPAPPCSSSTLSSSFYLLSLHRKLILPACIHDIKLLRTQQIRLQGGERKSGYGGKLQANTFTYAAFRVHFYCTDWSQICFLLYSVKSFAP